MTPWLILVALVFLAPPGFAGQKPNKEKAEIEVQEITVRRIPEDASIEVDGGVRNTGEHALTKLILYFELLAPGGETVARQKGIPEPNNLQPGEAVEFHWRMRDNARAVSLRIVAQHRGDFHVFVLKPGPYTIE